MSSISLTAFCDKPEFALPLPPSKRGSMKRPFQILGTGVENGNPQAVLDGLLDPFMEAALAQRVSGEAVEVSDID